MNQKSWTRQGFVCWIKCDNAAPIIISHIFGSCTNHSITFPSMINQCDGSKIGVCGGSLLYFSLTLGRDIDKKHVYNKVVL